MPVKEEGPYVSFSDFNVYSSYFPGAFGYNVVNTVAILTRFLE
jgi:hypothetical protein